MTELGIDPFTVPDLDPVDFIRAAHAAGFGHVSLRTVQAEGSNPGSTSVTDANLEDVLDALADTGLAVLAVDIVDVSADMDIARITSGLAVAQRLGSPSISVIAKSPDERSVREGLARLCDLALPRGISPRLEPITYLPTGSLPRVAEIVRSAPGAGIMIDALHMHRMGVTAREVAELTAGLPVTFQINGVMDLAEMHARHIEEGKTEPNALRWEALDGRLLPGEGENDVLGLRAALPDDIVPLVEAPRSPRVRGVGASEYLRLAHAAAAAALRPVTRSPIDSKESAS